MYYSYLISLKILYKDVYNKGLKVGEAFLCFFSFFDSETSQIDSIVMCSTE